MTALPKSPVVRSPTHRKFVSEHFCLVCMGGLLRGHEGPGKSQAAHVKFISPAYGTGLKPSDHYTAPLCDLHHKEQHSTNEVAWWQGKGFDPNRLKDICKMLCEASPCGKVK